jgi:hypothetical protein
LGIDAEERHQDDLLAIAEDTYITGIRIRNTPAPLDQVHMVQKMPPDMQTKEKQRALLFPVVKPAVKAGEVATPAHGILGVVRISLIIYMLVLMPIKGAQKGKSIWNGKGEEVVNVETYALQHYESLGYKGYHCEGRIVTTLFGLLFWDIIFAPIREHSRHLIRRPRSTYLRTPFIMQGKISWNNGSTRFPEIMHAKLYKM